jgi:hypothetical protein
MISAEVVCEAEKSWENALKEAIVTSSELHGLKLILRKKLLGDWFCEGDLGFIHHSEPYSDRKALYAGRGAICSSSAN